MYSFEWFCMKSLLRKKPFVERDHDTRLILDIIYELRPEINKRTPKCISEIIQQCWDGDPDPSWIDGKDLILSVDSKICCYKAYM